MSAKVSHGPLIDLKKGEAIEFGHTRLNRVQLQIAAHLGYRYVSQNLHLYARPKTSKGAPPD
ncbi:MAG: hypothetical protein AAGH48_10340 [Pseudomonadota bacterium]